MILHLKLQNTGSIPCAAQDILVSYFTHDSMYLLILYSHFAPLSSGNHWYIRYIWLCFLVFIYVLIYFCNFICKNDMPFCKFVHPFQFELQFFIGIIVIIFFFGNYLINDLFRQMFSFFCFSLRLALVLLQCCDSFHWFLCFPIIYL